MTPNASGETLREQYSRAIDEYRFQVELNWRRSEYFFVLNVGVLIAAATMFASDKVPSQLVAALFGVGALLATLSFLANDVQHGYYKSARELKRGLEEKLELGEVGLRTTPGQGSGIARLGRVGTFLKIMLVALGLADLVGAGFAIDASLQDSEGPPPKHQVVLEIATHRGNGGWSALVVSQDQKIVDVRHLGPNRQAPLLALPVGHYRVAVAGTSICRRELSVRDEPLQRVVLRC